MTTTLAHRDQTRATVLGFFERLNSGDVAGAAALVADDLVNHAAIPEAQGRAGFERIQAKLRTAVPDLRGRIDDVIVDGDRAVVRLTMSGTQTGPLDFVRLQLPPTGRAVSLEQIHIVRVVDGRIVEHWACRDDHALIRQLGMKIVPAA
jgi:steroid delta-isomerase-like uncharacterized protein